MSNFSSYNFKLNGAQHLKNNANTLALALNVTKLDNYATATSKVIASAALSGADIALTASGDDLSIVTNGKAIDPSGIGAVTDDLVVLLLDSTNSEVIICQDATDRIITNDAGDTVQIPALQMFVRELSAV